MKRFWPAAAAALVVALEALPRSAALTVAIQGETKRLYFSSFDPTPIVGQNFGPLLTAVSSSLFLLAALIFLIGGKKLKLVRVLGSTAFIFSLFPLFRAKECLTALGVAVSLVLLAGTVLSFSLQEGKPLPKGKAKGKASSGKKKKTGKHR